MILRKCTKALLNFYRLTPTRYFKNVYLKRVTYYTTYTSIYSILMLLLLLFIVNKHTFYLRRKGTVHIYLCVSTFNGYM